MVSVPPVAWRAPDASCFSDLDGRPRLLSPETVAAVSQIQTVGKDLILGHSARYAIVFQKPRDDYQIGSYQAFGHSGAGGSIGAGDPLHELAYGWIPRRMTVPGGADSRGPGPGRSVARVRGGAGSSLSGWPLSGRTLTFAHLHAWILFVRQFGPAPVTVMGPDIKHPNNSVGYYKAKPAQERASLVRARRHIKFVFGYRAFWPGNRPKVPGYQDAGGN